MDAGTLSIRQVFDRDCRHIVPLYQRRYVWERELQWEPLWEDIRAVAERRLLKQDTRPHFLGAIVLEQVPNPSGFLETRLVIDGQQRLTTLQVFLEALCDFAEEHGPEQFHKALRKLTRNDDPMSVDEIEIFKVWPTNIDQEDFRRVMLAGSPAELRKEYDVSPQAKSVNNNIGDAYLCFHELLTEWLDPGDESYEQRLNALYESILKYLRLVVIDLDQNDDPQLIFETLNARGTPLLPSDLIKNFLLHKARQDGDEPAALYTKYWMPFDENHEYWQKELGRGHARRARIDIFLQHFLTLKKKDDVSVAHLYGAFREFASNNVWGSASDIVSSIRSYAEVFRSFDQLSIESRVGLFFYRLNAMDVGTAFPFLMELFSHFEADEATVTKIVCDLESFLVRRMVCQLSTRGYGRFFIDLLPCLESESPAHCVRDYLLASDAENRRWPNDEEFRIAWEQTPLYTKLVRARVRMLLEAVEQELFTDKSEKLQFGEKLTIEHVMPQHWHGNWALPNDKPQVEAELEREKLLHTVGNLTLLTKKLNPSVSNSGWLTKKAALEEHSGLAMNRSIIKKKDWTEEEITKRSERLSKLALSIWNRP
ncbi:DUF262 domain-containing protein [Thalassoroseus pseudoceratinae]|uniref:DUF262 domain-containing protein n=1 Tax=Thalassoroseus pseudoceratinae TaxID=2713176 RepID=UPI001420E8EC|nr:DUF262 domain-containing protein [Thalassoroseus pseudoceratinae]